MDNLPHLPVLDHLDATKNFETLQTQLKELEAQNRRHAGGGTGAWVTLTLTAKLEAFSGFQTAAVRTEQGATAVRLRGVVKVKAGETLTAGETITTLPAGFRPPASVVVPNETAGTASFLSVTSAGVITSSATATTATGISLDGATFNLT